MKVAGMKNASGVRGIRERNAALLSRPLSLFRRSALSRHAASGPRYLVVTFLLAVSIVSTSTAPVKAARLEEQRAKESNNKSLREGMKAIRSGRYEDAVKVYLQILDADKSNVQAHLGAALAHMKNKDYRRCFEAATEAIKLDPKIARSH